MAAIYNTRCDYCGRYMKDGYVYTPWGRVTDEEPPDAEFVCTKCFTPERKKLLDRMWCPPYPIREE